MITDISSKALWPGIEKHFTEAYKMAGIKGMAGILYGSSIPTTPDAEIQHIDKEKVDTGLNWSIIDSAVEKLK